MLIAASVIKRVRAIGRDPLFEHRFLDPAHCLHFRDAGIGDTIHVAAEQFLLVLWRQLPVVRDSLVMVVRDKIKNILFEICAGTDDDMHFVAANHFGQRNAELGGRHRARDGHQHFAAGGEVRLVAFRGVQQRRRVEVTIIFRDEFRDRPFLRREGGVDLFRAF
jgi:hypothetical protein